MIRSVLKTLYWNQWLALALFFIFGDLISNWMLDIAFHDTYFVIGGYQIAFFVGSFFLISWLLFRFIPAFRALRWWARFHLAEKNITTFLFFLLLGNMMGETQPKRYAAYSEKVNE